MKSLSKARNTTSGESTEKCPPVPTFAEERELREQGYEYIAGIDEAGRGAIAGPVAAAAVILPAKLRARWIGEVRDSKLLTPKRRESLSQKILSIAVAAGVGFAGHEIIDSQGIARATRIAMVLAIEHLPVPPQTLLIDYFNLPEVDLPQKGVTDGDSLCMSIACASIIAKVARDFLMTGLDNAFPGYRFSNHKGYGTEEHKACLYRLGPSPVHRYTFRPVLDLMNDGQW